MDKLRMESPDMTALNIDRIAALFPNCITEMLDEEHSTPEKKVYKRAVNFELLKQMLSPDVVDGDEAYEFTWVGKKAAIVEANKPIRKTLRPVLKDETIPTGADSEGKPYCSSGSKDWDNTENLYIEGDNLEVLKLLQESYLGKVKMIYIDPPYNTGNDFIYADDFMRSQEEENEQMGMYDEDENRLFKNTDTNGRFHSDWCSMIYSRLMLARNLLTDDGVIFISIDDGEVGNLRKICDEVFGANNFLANLIWEKKYTVANDALFFSDNHDHILCYVKDVFKFSIGKLPRTDEMNAAYKNPDNHPKGPWKATPLHAKSGSAESANFTYTFKNGVTFKPPVGTYSRYSAETLKKYDENNEIWFGRDGTAVPSRKTFLCDLKNTGIVPRTIIPFSVGGHNHEAVDEVRALMQDNLFTNPKPTKLLRHLATIANCSDNSIILDFFSGSATTAHAVMQLNAEDGGHRKFIMVQLPEPCDEASEACKAGYKNICEIGKERIRRAGEKLLQDVTSGKGNIKGEGWGCGMPTTQEDRAFAIKNILDIGFRVLKLDDTNMKDVYYAPDDYDQGMIVGLESNIKDDRTDLDLLFGCLLEWGLPLSMPYRSEQVEGCTVHTYNDGDLIACFDENIPESVIREIAQRKPLRAVFRDSGFASSPEKINVFEIFKLYMPEDANDISKRVRVI